MCKLLGMSFRRDVDRNNMKSYLRDFFDTYGTSQPHGWGIALYNDPGHAPVLFKEPVEAAKSKALRYLLSLKHDPARYVIAHVRFRSMGPIVYHLTQPFVEKTFTFAHNGTLYGLSNKINTEKISDSLYMFGVVKRFGHDTTKFTGQLQVMNKHGSMSILASDGRYLLAYRDNKGCTPLSYRPFQGGFIVCSEPIFGRKSAWTEIRPGTSMVFKNGKLVDTVVTTPTREDYIDVYERSAFGF
jgi:predicted glutamine amidotransferase